MNARLYKRNNNKLELKIFNEISYILLFIMFFIGILGGSLAFKKVTNFDEYKGVPSSVSIDGPDAGYTF